MKKIHILLIVLAAIFFIFISTTLAWFVDYFTVNDIPDGGVVTGYFARGDGSKEDPFVITKPIHLYNLAWLQYMGILNQEKPDDNDPSKTIITQCFFELDPVDENGNPIDVLDMTGIILPPIGTTQYPFVGHFDGNGKTIENLTVSNYISDSDGVDLGIVTRPLAVDEVKDAEIIGFFGVVGANSDEIKSKIDDDSQAVDIRNATNAVHDLFLDNLIVRTETNQSLIGLLAGYVNGSIGNVGIGESYIQLGENVKDLTIGDMTQIISAYSLIGQYEAENVFWEDAPDKSWINNGGGETGWGGSIDIQQLRQRVAYIVGAVGLTSYKISGNYGYHSYFNAYQKNIIEGTLVGTTSVTAFLDGTLMPLSINQNIFKEDVVTTTNKANDGYLVTLPYYRDNIQTNKEPVTENNSGYIVGGGTRNWNTTKDTQYLEIKVEYAAGGTLSGKNYTTGIARSIGTSLSKEYAFPTDNTTLHLLTNDLNGNTYVITDEYNQNANTWFSANKTNYNFAAYNSTTLNLQKYGGENGVRNKFVQANAGKQYLQGLQFNPRINATSQSTIEKVEVDGVSLFGTNYDDYEMVKGAINFSLKGSGIVTAVAATMAVYPTSIDQTNTMAHSLFRIFKVERTNNKITNVEAIDTVHKVTINGQVTYEYNKGANYSAPGYELVFDFTKMSELKVAGAAYYFEIPLGIGDYAIGNITSDSTKKGAHLLYLDIGANGDQSMGDTTTTKKTHGISGVTFVKMDELSSINITNNLTGENQVINSTIGHPIIIHEIAINNPNHDGLTVYYLKEDKASNSMICTSSNTDAFTIKTASGNNAIQPSDLAKIYYYRRREDTA